MSDAIVKVEGSSHWYLADGTTYHTVKDAKVEDRPTTLRDARKVLARPSVTSILKTKANFFLEAWKIEQAIKSALTLPQLPGEVLDDFAKRVIEDSREQARKAAEFGTSLHDAIERFNLEGVWSPTSFEEDALEPFMVKYAQWFRENVEVVHRAECVLVHSSGYAGRMDLFARIRKVGNCVIDFKTQGMKRDGDKPKPAFYDDYFDQLVAYGDCLTEQGEQVTDYMSVVINSKEPEMPYTKTWGDPAQARKRFTCCFELWKAVKNYDPVAESV